MNTLNKYIIFFSSFFILLLITFIILALNNNTSGISNAIAVLMGSSLTAVISLSLESFRIKKKNKELELSIISELEYNEYRLNKILQDLKDEIENFENGSKSIKHPLPMIKTDLWDNIKILIDKKILGDTYKELIKLISNLEYINDHLKMRDNYVTINLNNSINYDNLKSIDKTLIKNIENAINNLNELSISFS